MPQSDWLAERFEEHRGRLTAVAHRMLGSKSEAEDAVQEAWLRLARTDADAVDDLGSWLTTVTARVCLNILQARRSKPEVPLPSERALLASEASAYDPEHETLLADSVGLALLLVLDTLTPAERVAFVLHDMFGVPFEEVAMIVGRSGPAARQLASRARRRVQREGALGDPGSRPERSVVEAFLAASRNGDFPALLALLDPEAVLRADGHAVRMGASSHARGAVAVAQTFEGRALGASAALIDGVPGAAWFVNDRPRVVFDFQVVGDRVVSIDVVADPESINRIDIALLDD